MRQAFVIARREFLERVKSKWFVIVTLLGPLLMIGVIVVPALLMSKGAETAKVVIVDHDSGIGARLVDGFATIGWKAELAPPTATEAELLAKIHDKSINAFLDLPKDAAGAGKVVYQGDNASSTQVLVKVTTVVSHAVFAARAEQAGITPVQLAKVIAPVDLDLRHTTGEAHAKSGLAVFAVGYALMFILYMGILLYGVAVMRSVVQEKTSRVIELMVATAKPRALMAGKIFGVGSVGVLQLGIWLGMALLALHFRAAILGAFGVAGGGPELPQLGLDQLAVAIANFLGGYFFYAAMYAAVGAMVSSDQEAQQAQAPVMILVILPMMCMQLVANDPRGTIAEVLTLLPFSGPILMPLRYVLGGASALDVFLSLGILAISTYLVVRAAAKIYRVGILMYGKRPSLKELWRWLRH